MDAEHVQHLDDKRVGHTETFAGCESEREQKYFSTSVDLRSLTQDERTQRREHRGGEKEAIKLKDKYLLLKMASRDEEGD